jgi:hypothetical protein
MRAPFTGSMSWLANITNYIGFAQFKFAYPPLDLDRKHARYLYYGGDAREGVISAKTTLALIGPMCPEP